MNTYDYHRRISNLEVKYLEAKEKYHQAALDETVTGPQLTRLKYERDFYHQELVQAQKDLDQYLKQNGKVLEAQQPKQTPIYENWGEFS